MEDEIAIKTLSSSKVLANEIVEKQTTAEAAKSRIDESRNEYYALTKYAVTLYFTGNYLSCIDHMYQVRCGTKNENSLASPRLCTSKI